MSGLEMRYFVLQPKGNDWHAAASRKALTTYATEVRDRHPKLASDIKAWVHTSTPVVLPPGMDQAAFDRLLNVYDDWDTEQYGYICLSPSNRVYLTNEIDCNGDRIWNRNAFNKMFLKDGR